MERGGDVVFGEAKCGRRRGADCGMEVAGPGAGLGGETIANGHGGNSTRHGSADHMLIGGLVAEYLILKKHLGVIHMKRGFKLLK